MDFDALRALLQIGGYAMLAHIALSMALRGLVRENDMLATKLFAIPNEWTGRSWGLHLLRARYYLLWRSAPREMRQQSPLARITFLLTRLTGLAVPIAMLTFLAGAVWLGTR